MVVKTQTTRREVTTTLPLGVATTPVTREGERLEAATALARTVRTDRGYDIHDHQRQTVYPYRFEDGSLGWPRG